MQPCKSILSAFESEKTGQKPEATKNARNGSLSARGEIGEGNR